MSRTRLVRPGFFGDEDIATMRRDSRLAYLGLTTECDDAGYFEARPRQLARALFGFDSDGVEVIKQAIEDLVGLGKVELLPCGEHGIVPSLPVHAQQGGNKAFNHQAAHTSKCESGLVRTERQRPTKATPSERVRTRPTPTPTAPKAEPVRTSPDKSRSESESVSESVTREKNVKEGGVDGANSARDAGPDIDLSDPNRAGRARASSAPMNGIRPPARLESITPKWKTPPGPCRQYARHANSIRLEGGEAVCDACAAEFTSPPAPPPTTGTQDGLGLT